MLLYRPIVYNFDWSSESLREAFKVDMPFIKYSHTGPLYTVVQVMYCTRVMGVNGGSA